MTIDTNKAIYQSLTEKGEAIKRIAQKLATERQCPQEKGVGGGYGGNYRTV